MFGKKMATTIAIKMAVVIQTDTLNNKPDFTLINDNKYNNRAGINVETDNINTNLLL